MRFTRRVFAFLAFSATLLAADPFVGTWKLNSTKTKFTTGVAPKEQTLTFTEEGNTLHIMVKGTSTDGKAISSHFTVPTAGGTGTIIESYYDGVSTKIISPTQRETTYTKGGKPVYTAKSRISADGKTLTVNVNGTNPLGQTVAGTAVYDKE